MAHPKRKPSEQDHLAYSNDGTRSAEIVPMPMANGQTQSQPQYQRIGDILRNERERRGDDLQHIADHLCIRRGFLVAIENSNYDEFPADIYVIGFLRSYAQYLGLDGQEVIDYYRHEMEGRRHKPALVLPVPISEGRTPSVFVLIGAAVAALVIYISWYSLSTSDRAKVVPPPTLPVTSSAETSANSQNVKTSPEQAITPTTVPDAVVAPTAPVAMPESQTSAPPATAPESLLPPAPATPAANAPAVATKPSRITIKAAQSSWVMIADGNGHSVFDNVMKPGETFAVPNMPGLTLTTGNGAGIVIMLDGKELPKLTGGASMTRNISLSPDALKHAP